MINREKLKVAVEIVADDPKELLRYKEVKRLTGWSSGTIRNRVNEGKLVRVAVGPGIQNLRITRKSLEAYLEEVNDEIETREFLGKTPGEWAALKEAKKREQDQNAILGKPGEEMAAGTVVDDSQIVRNELGAFASVSYDYMDPLSRRVVPAGCFIDSDETIVAGHLEQWHAELIYRKRCARRGIPSPNARYHAMHVSTKVDEYWVRLNEWKLGQHNRRNSS